jgi:hypothetical protein
LIELGADAKAAIQTVRHARPGAIENNIQEHYILSWTVDRNSHENQE